MDQLAKRIGLSKSYLSLLERNERDPPLSTLKRIAQALGLPFSVLILLGTPPEELEGISPVGAEKLAAAMMKILQAAGAGSK